MSEAWAIHEQACARGELSYTDPTTGYRVFTRLGLERRSSCCGCGCRHCPFEHEAVEDKAARIQQPAWLHRRSEVSADGGTRHVLFWSGGKDSLLALRAWLRQQLSRGVSREAALDSLILMTTFDASSRVVAHQNVAIVDVRHQAETLDLDLLAVPLHPGTDYLERLRSGLALVERGGAKVGSLIFGDLHLQHVKDWRDSELSSLGYTLSYPVWQVPWPELLKDLEASAVPCVVSACPGKEGAASAEALGVAVGTRFDAALASRLKAAGWDPFGEDGEFHTLAQVWCSDVDTALGG